MWGGLQSHWCLFVSLFCFTLWSLAMFLSTLAASSLQLLFLVAFCFLFSFLSWEVSLILHYFPLWSHLSQFPVVRGCCHSLLHVTPPQSMPASSFSPHTLPYNSKSELLCNSPESGFPIALSSIAYLWRGILRDDISRTDNWSLKSYLYSAWPKNLWKEGEKLCIRDFFSVLNIVQ